jgi:hypothetical protein
LGPGGGQGACGITNNRVNPDTVMKDTEILSTFQELEALRLPESYKQAIGRAANGV